MQSTNTRNKRQQNRSLRGQTINPLPFIDNRKPNLLEDHLRYTNNLTRPPQQPLTISPDKPFKSDSPFIHKDFANNKKKLALSPNKVALRQKLYQTLESQKIKKQLDQVKSSINEGVKQLSALSSNLKNIDKDDFSKRFRIISQKPSNRSGLYQPYKKKSSANQRDKLKPITSETKISSNQVYFFNVQKMVLLQGDRHKKSNSLIVNGFTEERSPVVGRSQKQQVPNSKLIKEINIIKEKLNIQRVLSLNQETQFRQGKNLTNIINICSLENRSGSQIVIKEDMSFCIEGDKQKIQEIKSYHLQKDKLYETQLSQTDITQKCESLGLKNKQTTSPLKRIRRKLIIPFQTYFYRDLLWKVNYTNGLYVEVPLQYEHRLKVFVGKGNNSNMVGGLIARRPWYAFTDKVQQANFVWTQLKDLSYYKKQQQFTGQINHEQLDNGKYQAELILTTMDSAAIAKYHNIYLTSEQHSDQRLLSRSKVFKYRQYIKQSQIKQQRLQNHLINNYVIGNKKALFNTMSNYYKEINMDVFDFLPLTFHIRDGMEDKKYFQFLKYYHKRAKEIARTNQEKGRLKEYNAWIVKPGENSNRGNGIKMCLSLQEIKAVLKKRDRYPDGSYRTYIVQAYIERPLLYCKRKFDLRHYIMLTCINGLIKGYWYKDGYVRTTSSQYSLNYSDGSIHLTNDAVQKNLPQYGKYQKGNKLSYEQLSTYIQKYHRKKEKGFYQTIYPKMKLIATDAMRACSGGIDPNKLQNNFQIFGMDFMIDAKLDVWLIQINTNPCLELSCPLLGSIIPKMVENALQLTMDAIFPPPVRYCPKGMHYFKQLEKENKFELVYDERVEKLYTGSLQVLDNKLLQEQDDTFVDEGQDWEQA